MKINPVVLVGIPTLQDAPISWEWHDAMKSMQFPLGTAVSHIRVVNKIVADARNIIGKQAIAMNADKVLYISDDVIPPTRIFEMLNRHQKDMVTGIYWTKETNPKPYIWRGQMSGPYENWKFGEFFEIDWAGCDALLVDTKVFRKIPYPWFSHDWTWRENLKFSLATEDQYFYAKTKQYGFQLYCDSSVQCGHQDRTTKRIFGLTEETLQVQERRKLDKSNKLKAVIGTIFPSNISDEEVVWICDNEKMQPDIRCDYRTIPDVSNKYDIVISDVLDKFKIEEAVNLIKEWYRIVKVNGILEISVANVVIAALEVLKADANINYETNVHELLYENGRQVSFTRYGLQKIINEAGFDCDIIEKDNNIVATVTKKEKSEIFCVTNTFEKFIRDDNNTLEKKVKHAIILGSMQKEYELMEMAKLIEAKQPKVLVEIGTDQGETFALFCQICPQDSTLVSIDLPGGSFGSNNANAQKLKSGAKGNQQIHCILGDSHSEKTKTDLLEIIDKIDVLLIDGDHTYEGVKKDFEMYSPLMNNGGLIFFHDILFHPFNHGCEVNLFWRQLKEKYETQEFIDQDDINWGGIGMIEWKK